MRPEPREYQRDLIKRVAGAFTAGTRRVLLQLATGGGKTMIFAYVTWLLAQRGKRIIIMAHRDALLDQISKALTLQGVHHGFIAAGRPAIAANVQVCSVGTLARRVLRPAFREWLSTIDYIIPDEAHHVAAESWNSIFKAAGKARVFGVTATPERADGQGLGEWFDDLIVGPSVAWLTENGWLAPALVFRPESKVDLSTVHMAMGDYNRKELAGAVDRPTICGDAIQQFRRYGGGERTTIISCVNIGHAERVAHSLRDAGYRAEHVAGVMGKDEVRRRLSGLGSEHQFLAFCDLISEGVDIPNISAIVELRPTHSPVLCAQIRGRGLRPAPGKDDCMILDLVGNTLRHNRPIDEKEWTLETRTRGSRSEKTIIPRTRTCPNCFAVASITAERCPRPDCGEEFPPPEPYEPKVVDGDLVLDDAPPIKAKPTRVSYDLVSKEKEIEMLFKCGDLQDFQNVAKLIGKSHTWAHSQWKYRNFERHAIATGTGSED